MTLVSSFDESLVHRTTPWAACAALEQFLSQGGRCCWNDNTNWLGILSLCEMNIRSDASKRPDVLVAPSLHEAFAWARLTISICESLASSHPPERPQSPRQSFVSAPLRAMWARTHMIVRCGNFPGDPICDREKVVEWCMSGPEIRQLLETDSVPAIYDVDPDVRLNAQILSALIAAGKLEEKGDVARFLSKIEQATRKSVGPESG